jgi:hypothetical protein
MIGNIKEKKIYTYKNKTYKLKPVTLEVLSSAAPLLAKFRKLQGEYTSDIDLSKVHDAKNRIIELETAIEQLKENSGNEDKEGSVIRISELEQKLNEAIESFNNNDKLQSKLKLYNECTGLAMMELLGSTDVISLFLKKAICSTEGSKELVINYDDTDAIDFIREVITDFFEYIAGARKKSAG